jgi:hypothetical protein
MMHLEALRPKKDTVITSITHGPIDYEFLLGSIRQHSEIADAVVVLDVSPKKYRKKFKNLPGNVQWVYEDKYQSNTRMYASRPAMLRCIKLAKGTGCKVIGHLDSDEFFTLDAKKELFPKAIGRCVETHIVTWSADGFARWGDTVRVRRVWDLGAAIYIPQNSAWQKSEHYDGNPERHPIVMWPSNTKVLTFKKLFHHHVHWTFKEKGLHTFGGKIHPEIPDQDDFSCWPELLRRWRVDGIKPSEEFL